MVHGGGGGGGGGGHGNRSKARGLVAEKKKRPTTKPLSVKNQKKPKAVSLKNQIRSTERMLLRKNLPSEVTEAQKKKLDELKKQQDLQTRLSIERKIFSRNRKIKFFERRKVESRIRRLERLQRTSDNLQDADVSDQLSKLKEDLEYVRFFPRTEKYVSLFTGGDDTNMVDKRNHLRKKIKSNIMAAAASGKEIEETGSDGDGLLDVSEDDFFLAGNSSDEADADDEMTDKSAREQASSASGKATSGMSSDEKNQKQMFARVLMPPPRPSKKPVTNPSHKTGNDCSTSKKPVRERVHLSLVGNKPHGSGGSSFQNRGSSNSTSCPSSSLSSNPFRERVHLSLVGNKPHGSGGSSFQNRGSSNSTSCPSSSLSSNSDAHKPRRKRRPKKKKQQV